MYYVNLKPGNLEFMIFLPTRWHLTSPQSTSPKNIIQYMYMYQNTCTYVVQIQLSNLNNEL